MEKIDINHRRKRERNAGPACPFQSVFVCMVYISFFEYNCRFYKPSVKLKAIANAKYAGEITEI